MRKLNPGVLFPFTGLILLIIALSTSVFRLPPLGKALDPFRGLVQNDRDETLNRSASLLQGLKDPVRIFFDERRVPHIYAKNDTDLYFAQGYTTAKLRLWQMDFLCYAAAGRLSELFDDSVYLSYDRNQRRLGLLDAARKSLELIQKDSATIAVLSTYTRGVNACIDELGYANLPVEYKLMDYRPEHWSNLKTVLVLKQMGNTLAGFDEDMAMTRLMMVLGETDFNKLYGGTVPVSKPGYLDYSFLASQSMISESAYNPKLGSNSWAVTGKKTRSGHPILASDPHLNLSLPCVWLEMQLSSPNVNVYGVSIPGTPAILIGFNEQVAWGITNGADDVRDWYKLRISPDHKKYAMDGKWLPLLSRVEEIRRKGQKPFLDTIYSSIHGPIIYSGRFPGKQPEYMDYACRWELYNPSNEFKSFLQLSRARNMNDCRLAIKQYHFPALNFVFASKDDRIAAFHQGNLAVRSPGEGKFILDGTRSCFIPDKYIPVDSLPHVVDPACQYVASANQRPAGAGYPYYYDGYYSETRAEEISKLLAPGNLDIGKMEKIQLNNTDSFATGALPVVLRSIDVSRLTREQQDLLNRLRRWNGAYDKESDIAGLFAFWWWNISYSTWDELRNYSFNLRMPNDRVLLDLIEKDPFNHYFDELETTEKESAGDIVTMAFVAAAQHYAEMKSQGFRNWGELNKISITHLTRIPALSVMNLTSGGHHSAINAMSGTWGPSWRMIVELGDRPRGVGVYPGGQSGNPGSIFYSNLIDKWNRGEYFPLLFFLSPQEAGKDCKITWTLTSK